MQGQQMEHEHHWPDAGPPRPEHPRSQSLQGYAVVDDHPNSVAPAPSAPYPTPPSTASSAQSGTSPAFFAGQTNASIAGGHFINQQGAQVSTHIVVNNINHFNHPVLNGQAQVHDIHSPVHTSSSPQMIPAPTPHSDSLRNTQGVGYSATPMTGPSRMRGATYPNPANDSNAENRTARETAIELEHSKSISSHKAAFGGGDSPPGRPSTAKGNSGATSHVKRTPGTNRLGYLIELACGLERLHNQGLVYGGLRSDNATQLLNSSHSMSPGGPVKSKALSENKDPRWLAPEVLRNKHLVSQHADVWSFGMVCLEVLSGVRPFAGLESDLDVMRGLLNGNIPERPGKTVIERGLSDAMWKLLRGCWHKRPESRPSITEVKSTLLKLQGHAPAIESNRPVPKRSTSFFSFSLRNPAKRPALRSSTFSEGGAMAPPTPASTHSHGYDEDDSSFLASDESSPRQTTGHNSSSSDTSFYTSSLRSQHKTQSPLSTPFHPWQLPPLDIPPYSSSSPSLADSGSSPPIPDRVSMREDVPSSLNPDVTSSDSSDHAPPGSPEAVTTLDKVVIAPSGTVRGGTLEGLVDRLIMNSEDAEYRDTLLAACAELTTSNHLFSVLSRRFYDVGRDPRIQLCVLTLMKRWLSLQSLTGQTRLLVQVRSFCDSTTHSTASKVLVGRVAELMELIDDKSKGNILPHHFDRRVLTALEMTPHNLAIALTLLEGDKYMALTPADYILYLKRHPDEHIPHLQARSSADRVEDAYITHHLIIYWVEDSILYSDDVEVRAATLKFFINTAEECHKLHNFSSLVAVASALHSLPITRLRLTKAKLLHPMQKQLDNLRDVIDSSSNHRRYRKLLKQATKPKGQGRCVPWLSVHLEDLRQPLRENPSLQEMGGRMLINFGRYLKFTDRIKEVLHYRAPDLESHREQGQLAYLEDQLGKTEALDYDFMERAETLEPDNSSNRAKEQLEKLKQMGFR